MAKSDSELEVKFYLSRPKEVEARLIRLGALLKEPRVFEINLRFDTRDLALLKTGRLLRLRKDSRARVTYKGPGRIDGGARLRQELEFTVSDFDMTRAVFEALEFEVFMIYEKYRTTYELGDLEVVLDELPYGDFIEIEGPDGESIQNAAHRLNLQWEARILDSYTVLFEHARTRLGFDFRDLSFGNFLSIAIPPEVLGVSIADQA